MTAVAVTSLPTGENTQPVTFGGKTYYAKPGSENDAIIALSGGTCNKIMQDTAASVVDPHAGLTAVTYAGRQYWVDPMTAARYNNPNDPNYAGASKLVKSAWVAETGGSSSGSGGLIADNSGTGNQQDIVTGLWSRNPVNTKQTYADTGKITYTPTQNEFHYAGSGVAGAGGTKSTYGQISVSKETAALIAGTDFSLYKTPAPTEKKSPLLNTQQYPQDLVQYNPVSGDIVKTLYVPEGNYMQQEFQNVKIGMSESGELGIYEKLGLNEAGKQRMTVNPDTGKLEAFMLVGGGGRNALQSGTFGFAAGTTAVYGRGTVQKGEAGLVTPKVLAPEAAASGLSGAQIYGIVKNGIATGTDINLTLSRLGAEAYGGVVQRNDNRTLGNIRYEDVSNRAGWNLASYVDPLAVNKGKAELPGAHIPWSVGETTAPAFFMDKNTTSGEESPSISLRPFNAVVASGYGGSTPPSDRLVGSKVVASVSVVTDISPTDGGVNGFPSPFISSSSPQSPPTTIVNRPSDIDLNIMGLFGGGAIAAGLITVSDFWLGGGSTIKTTVGSTKVGEQKTEYGTPIVTTVPIAGGYETTTTTPVTTTRDRTTDVSITQTQNKSGFFAALDSFEQGIRNKIPSAESGELAVKVSQVGNPFTVGPLVGGAIVAGGTEAVFGKDSDISKQSKENAQTMYDLAPGSLSGQYTFFYEHPTASAINLAIGVGVGGVAGAFEKAYIGTKAITAEKIISTGGKWRVAEQAGSVVMGRAPQVLAGLYAADITSRSTEGFTTFGSGSVTKARAIVMQEAVPMGVGFGIPGGVAHAVRLSDVNYQSALQEGATNNRFQYYVGSKVSKPVKMLDMDYKAFVQERTTPTEIINVESTFPPVPEGYTRIGHVTVGSPDVITGLKTRGLEYSGPGTQYAGIRTPRSGVLEHTSVDLTGQGKAMPSAPGATPQTWFKAAQDTYIGGKAGRGMFGDYSQFGPDIFLFDVKPELYDIVGSKTGEITLSTGSNSYVGKLTRPELETPVRIIEGKKPGVVDYLTSKITRPIPPEPTRNYIPPENEYAAYPKDVSKAPGKLPTAQDVLIDAYSKYYDVRAKVISGAKSIANKPVAPEPVRGYIAPENEFKPYPKEIAVDTPIVPEPTRNYIAPENEYAPHPDADFQRFGIFGKTLGHILPPSTFGEVPIPFGVRTPGKGGSSGGSSSTSPSSPSPSKFRETSFGGKVRTGLAKEPSLSSMGIQESAKATDITTPEASKRIGSRTDYRGTKKPGMKPMDLSKTVRSGTSSSILSERLPGSGEVASQNHVQLPPARNMWVVGQHGVATQSSQVIQRPSRKQSGSTGFVQVIEPNLEFSQSNQQKSPVMFVTPVVSGVRPVLTVQPITQQAMTQSNMPSVSIKTGTNVSQKVGTTQHTDLTQKTSQFQETSQTQKTSQKQRQQQITVTNPYTEQITTGRPPPDIPGFSWPGGSPGADAPRYRRRGAFVETFNMGLDMAFLGRKGRPAKSYTTPASKKRKPKAVTKTKPKKK